LNKPDTAMHAEIADKRDALIALCKRYDVARLEVFGSALRAADFDPARSDVDFLVTFAPYSRDNLAAFVDLKEALEALLGRPVDLVERQAVEASRNFIRRRILEEAEAVYG
jgi:predicted nucleotidyltransferase